MKNADKPVYPLPAEPKFGYIQQDAILGLTKREYFAAMAMQGLSSIRIGSGANQEAVIECDAKAAVQYADALLSELEKTETP